MFKPQPKFTQESLKSGSVCQTLTSNLNNELLEKTKAKTHRFEVLDNKKKIQQERIERIRKERMERDLSGPKEKENKALSKKSCNQKSVGKLISPHAHGLFRSGSPVICNID